MFKRITKTFKERKYRAMSSEIAPDEIFLDSSNLPDYDTNQFEGRLEKPIAKKVINVVLALFLLGVVGYGGRIWFLQIENGKAYAEKSENNTLRHTLVFASRGIISDRNNVLLAWNEYPSDGNEFALRKYASDPGLSGLLGYLKYPKKDKAGFYYNTEYEGKDGIERYFHKALSGQNGLKITETDALGKFQSDSVVRPPEHGENIVLSIDAKLQSALYTSIATHAKASSFVGGAGIIMDVRTGEILSMATYPEYNSQVLTDGTDVEAIKNLLNDKNNPFLDRAVGGLYAPGSIMKPYVALAALQEKIIDPNKHIHTIGYLSLPNPYDPSKPSIFKDWKDHGDVDMRKALEQSSDVYFYEIGGGFENQPGLGIARIEKYVRSFGFGESFTGIFAGPEGNIPNPEWKKANFDGEEWRVGNTYHTSIGQYGFQVTPLQVVRGSAALANKGTLIDPTLILNTKTSAISAHKNELVDTAYYTIVHEGMRQAVTQGTAMALNIPGLTVAGKTGTAQIGVHNENVNSWVTGFFPYENPKYAFALVMEKGPVKYPIGAPGVMGEVLQWMVEHTPQYVK